MKILSICSILLFCSSIWAKPSMKEIPVLNFVNGGETDVSQVLESSEEIKAIVFSILKNNLTFHEANALGNFSDADFDDYWNKVQSFWHFVTFQSSGEKVLIFNGKAFESDSKEALEIFKINNKSDREARKIYSEEGELVAFKRHPRTKELLLFLHSYPCCQSASHSIIEIRFIQSTIKTRDKFFLGRNNGDMVGPFFPDSLDYPKENKQLTSENILRWSPAVVDTLAFEGRTDANTIIKFTEGSFYKQLYTTADGWNFVLILNGIDMNDQSMVLHPSNFKNRPIYGWFAPDSL